MSSSLEILLIVVGKSDNLTLLSDMTEQHAVAAGLQCLNLDGLLWLPDASAHRHYLEQARDAREARCDRHAADTDDAGTT